MEQSAETCTELPPDTGNKPLLDDSDKTEEITALGHINGCDEITDPLDLLEHVENESIGSNSDIWKNSDSEDESVEQKQGKKRNSESLGEKTSDASLSENMSAVLANPMEEDLEACLEAHILDKTTGHDFVADELRVEEPNVLSERVLDAIGDGSKSDEQTESPTDKQASRSDKPESGFDKSESGVEKPESGSDKSESGSDKPESDLVDDSISLIANQSGKPDSADSSKLNGHDEVSDKAVVDEDAEEAIVVEEQDPLSLDNGTFPSHISVDGSEMDYDDDFDPSLLCPEVTMAVDDTPVLTSDPIKTDATDTNHLKRIGPTPEPLPNTFHHEVTGDLIEFNLTEEEHEFRKSFYGSSNHIPYSKLHCTACNCHLGSAADNQKNRFVHPHLKVLICKGCFEFYTSGDFEKDEDGSELYCRWCGQGGQVLCCSSCEFVFCKRCITLNLGRKQMMAVKESDNWNCFRCNPSQIIRQRASCYELFEYIHSAIMSGTIKRGTDEWKTDFSMCCLAKKRHSTPGGATDARKAKRVKKEEDHDYNPHNDLMELVAAKNKKQAQEVQLQKNKQLLVGKPHIQLVPANKLQSKPPNKDADVQFVRQIPGPQMVVNPVKNVHTPLRAILPNSVVRTTGPNAAVIRVNPLATSTPLLGIPSRMAPPLQLINPLQGRIMTMPKVQHEWFEKTSRASARVNSNLTYTFNQLGKTLQQAKGVEDLAGVHNKLQETLSTSINSLISIRKQLRTEFINGIKTYKFPPRKPQQVAPSGARPPQLVLNTTSSHDDDVIIVGSSPVVTATAPSCSTTTSTTTIKLPSQKLFLVDSAGKSGTQKRSFIKLKTVEDINKSSTPGCITIPDDSPPLPPPLTPAPVMPDVVEVAEVDPLDVSGEGGKLSDSVADAKEAPESSEEKQEVSNSKVTTNGISNGVVDVEVEYISSASEKDVSSPKNDLNKYTNSDKEEEHEDKANGGVLCRNVVVKLEKVDLFKLQKELNNRPTIAEDSV